MKVTSNIKTNFIGIEKGIVAEKTMTAQIDTIPKAPVLQPKQNVLLRLPEVLAMFPVGRSTWYAGIKAQIYPRPVLISRRSVAWTLESIESLISRQMGLQGV
jgi:predicted DNA-binding transcriptional regulator AlpA